MKNLLTTAFIAGCALSTQAFAQSHDHHNHHNHAPHGAALNISSHDHHDHSQHRFAPISIMGDHMHDENEWMVSYRYMRMEMDGNRDGTNDLDPTEISGVFPNATTTGPTTLRIVPTEMTMEMHMLGAMYGLTDAVTLMFMGSYVEKEMDHITFAGANAANQIGEFTTTSDGFGDTKFAALYDAYNTGNHQWVLRFGASLPTGETDETGEALSPMNVRQTLRLPYAMQIGTGTFDLEPAITYSGHNGNFGWGAQYMGHIRLGENQNGYTFGDKHMLTGWLGYKPANWLLATARVSGETEETIDGQDANINGPVQTADPDNYGGERVEIGLGLQLNSSSLKHRGHNFGGEFVIPVHQDLNGPQMKRDYAFTFGYQYTF